MKIDNRQLENAYIDKIILLIYKIDDQYLVYKLDLYRHTCTNLYQQFLF